MNNQHARGTKLTKHPQTDPFLLFSPGYRDRLIYQAFFWVGRLVVDRSDLAVDLKRRALPRGEAGADITARYGESDMEVHR